MYDEFGNLIPGTSPQRANRIQQPIDEFGNPILGASQPRANRVQQPIDEFGNQIVGTSQPRANRVQQPMLAPQATVPRQFSPPAPVRAQQAPVQAAPQRVMPVQQPRAVQPAPQYAQP